MTEKAGCLYSEGLSIIPGAALFRILLPLVVFLSGACGLVYQSLWLRSLGLVLGSGSQAASLTLATFMGGLGLGAWLVRRMEVKNVLKAYAVIEAGMAASVLASLILLPALPSAYAWLSNLNLIPPLAWLGKLLLASLIVLPQATLAGATMPLLIGYQVQNPRRMHQGLARLYLLNTLGAATGVFACAFVLMPNLGLRRSVLAAAAVNLGLAWLAWRQRDDPVTKDVVPAADDLPSSQRLFAWMAMGSGALGLGLELLWTRSLSLVIGSTIYAFNLMLLAVLLGLVLGTWAYERWLSGKHDADRWLRFLLLGLACLLPLQCLLIGQLPAYYLALKQSLPHDFASHQLAGFALSFFCLLLVTAPLGMLFPLISHVTGANAWTARGLSARLFQFNAAGAVLGALGAGFLLIPAMGLQISFAWMAAIPLSLGLLSWGLSLGWQPRQLLALPLGVLLLTAGVAPHFHPWDPGVMSSGTYLAANDLAGQSAGTGSIWRSLKRFFAMPYDLGPQIAKISQLLYYHEDAEAVIAVRQNLSDPAITLVINGKPDAGDRDQSTQKLLAHLPLLLHPNPKNALIIGWGSGCSAGTTGIYPLESITCVELVPATVDTAVFFQGLNRGILNDPRFKLRLQDGRTYLAAAQGGWDVISAEPPNPWISGVANLFTAEFYAIALRHLNPGGIFCQFFHYYNMSDDDLKLEFRTFAAVFPQASLWLVPATAGQDPSGDMILIGSVGAQTFPPGRVAQAMQDPVLAADLRSLGMSGEADLLATRVFGQGGMLAYAGQGPLNTDDRPALEFSAPRSLYRSGAQNRMENQRHFLSLSAAKTP